MGFLPSNYKLTICILYSLILCLSSSSAHLCHNDESTALLQFKQLFSFDCHRDGPVQCSSDVSAPFTDNWKEGTNCCAWDGVTCDNTTAHVIGLDLNCHCLYGTINPNSSLFHLVHLQYLDLSVNNFNHSQILPSFGRFTNLIHLDLSYSYLSGPIQSSEEVWQGNNFSSSIFHLQKLQELWLSGNKELTGKLPSFINETLRHLTVLALDTTGFTGELPNSIGQLENLQELYLDECNFSGTIPRSLTNLTQLISLSLSYNNFEGPIPPFSNFSLPQLIYFSNNQLTGPIPSSLFDNLDLDSLALSSNNFSDTVELDTFAKLFNLYYLNLSNSGLSLTTTNSTPSSFLNIGRLLLSSCNIRKIPEFLKTQKENLELLDLSNNHLNEELNPLCNLHSLRYLDLSNNQFVGLIPTCLGNFNSLTYLDLSNNQFAGLIPICLENFKSLVHLDLSNNQFAGLIPTCLGNFNGNLTVLNLQRNNFHGSIPETFGHASMLQELDISHNGLQGVLPRSLVNCTNLEILNLGHNFIEDTFPFWLENLSQLKVIVLRQNKFHGPIGQPRNKLAFTTLHILDMSHNELTGTLPSKYFERMHSMMMDDENKSSLNYMHTDNGYYYSVTIMIKGLEMQLVRIITIFKTVDFSHNKFDGNIPISIGRLKALYALNFSSNGLTGLIPVSLGDLTELESLDLSQNKLSGEIPRQLTSLTFLEVFDVSQNNLTGIVPRGQQFETFSNTSYEGNIGLCGFPLSKKCGSPKAVESPSLSSSSSHDFKYKLDGFEWEAVLMGYGCGVVIGLVIGSCIIRRKEKWLVRIFRVKMCHQKNKSNEVRYQHGTR